MVEMTDEKLCVEVMNPGRIGRSSDSTGVGLTNVRARLALLWGERASLALEQVAEDLVRARLTMPALRMENGGAVRESARAANDRDPRGEARDGEVSTL